MGPVLLASECANIADGTRQAPFDEFDRTRSAYVPEQLGADCGSYLRRSFFGFGEPLDRTGAIGALPKDPLVPLAIRLKRNPLAIGGPERIAIRSPKSKTARRIRTRQIVDPNRGLFAIIGSV